MKRLLGTSYHLSLSFVSLVSLLASSGCDEPRMPIGAGAPAQPGVDGDIPVVDPDPALGAPGTGPDGTGGEGSTSTPLAGAPPGCPDLFNQDVVGDYALEISPADWAQLEQEFVDFSEAAILAPPYHPAVFRFGDEVIPDAAVRLRGQSSRVQEAMAAGPGGKMQFVVAFDVSANRKFRGVSKLKFDMPPTDHLFLHQRLATRWFRERGIAAPCSHSGRLHLNGAYYGLFVVEESFNRRVLKQFFPDNPNGDLFKAGVSPDFDMPNWARIDAFWAATDFASMTGIVDMERSLREWAIEVLMNNADGYYGGAHNFYVYDQGPRGWVFLPQDMDATFDWRSKFDMHPLFWWSVRSRPSQPGQHYRAVINDPAGRELFVNAMEQELAAWNTERLQSWIDTWSIQITESVLGDTRRSTTDDEFGRAITRAKESVTARAELVRSFIACHRGEASLDDVDQDGHLWCNDCRDDDASISPGAPEICGNGVDDNCNGLFDEGCPPPPAADPSAVAAITP